MITKLQGLGLALLLGASQAQAHLIVHADELAVTDDIRRDIRAGLAHDLAAGAYDRSGITWPVLTADGIESRPVTAALFQRLSPMAQWTLVDALAEDAEFVWRTYRVKVDTTDQDLWQEEIFARLNLDPSSLADEVPAEQLLSPFARTWAYRDSGTSGPNCWHTSMASIFLGWTDARYMSPGEYACHIRESFTELTDVELDDLQFGDMIRLSDGGEVHGFTYLGTDSADARRHLVFTKNGYARSRYVFMEIATVRDVIYSGNDVTYHRPHRVPADPSTDVTSECYDAFRRGTFEPEANPMVLAGYRLRAARARAVVELLP